MSNEKQWFSPDLANRMGPAQYVHSEDAVFLGWQETYLGKLKALFCVTAAGHPSYGSTVSDKTLHKLNMRVPQVSPPQEK
jgi:hypothetical protein